VAGNVCVGSYCALSNQGGLVIPPPNGLFALPPNLFQSRSLMTGTSTNHDSRSRGIVVIVASAFGVWISESWKRCYRCWSLCQRVLAPPTCRGFVNGIVGLLLRDWTLPRRNYLLLSRYSSCRMRSLLLSLAD